MNGLEIVEESPGYDDLLDVKHVPDHGPDDTEARLLREAQERQRQKELNRDGNAR